MAGATMQFMMSCRCGHEEEVEPEQASIGAVWRCPACGEYSARVRCRDGRAEWVILDRGYADWKGVSDEPDEEEIGL